jgi:formamidopyrimidine-DNA glycosylase
MVGKLVASRVFFWKVRRRVYRLPPANASGIAGSVGTARAVRVESRQGQFRRKPNSTTAKFDGATFVPELPEVETMRRGVLSIVGRRIDEVRAAGCRKRPILISPRLPALRRRAVGRTIVAVDRIGKRVVVRLDSLDALIFEPRMTGLVLLAAPPTREHVRLCVRLSGRPVGELLFWDRRGLGLVRLVAPVEFDRLYGPEKLGPDALAVSSEQLRERFCESRRPIKVALLDQRALAGVGNLYASEVVHRAGVDPRASCNSLTHDQWQRIHTAMREILQQAILYEGSTLGDGTYRTALNGEGGFQNHHRVYDRNGQLCATCGQCAIERIVQAQRSTFFCPRCQPAARPARRTPCTKNSDHRAGTARAGS